MLEIKDFKPRKYQSEIVKTALNSNTLAVLPTGTGKTKLAILLSVKRLNKYPNSKVLIVSPTRPLSAQIQKEFQSNITLNPQPYKAIGGKYS